MKESLHIYTRVSTRAQEKDGTSLDTQAQQGKAVAKKLKLTPIIHNEGGKSSNHEDIDKRPVLASLLASIIKGEVKHLYAYNIDRLSRVDIAQATIRQALRENDVLLYTGTDTHPTTLSDPKDAMFLQITSAIAQYENALRTARSRTGKIERTKAGYWHGGPPPFGYEIIDKQLSPHKEESKIVRTIYDKYISGQTLSDIRDYLFSKNIPTRRGKASWSDASLQNILTENTHYTGYYLVDFSETETIRVECPRIVSPEQHKKAKAEYKKRSRTQGGRQAKVARQKRVFLLRDYLFCGHCGNRYGATHSPKARKSDYYCSHHQNYKRRQGEETPCDSPRNSINIEETDIAVMTAVCDVLSQSHSFREQIKKEVIGSKDTHQQNQAKIKNTEKRIRETKKEIKKIREQIVNLNLDNLVGISDSSDIKSIYARLQDYQTDREEQLQEYENTISGLETASGWLDWIDSFGQRIDEMLSPDRGVEEQKTFLSGILDRITVTFSDKQTANLDISLLYPYDGDRLRDKDSNNKRKGYTIQSGKTNKRIKHAIKERQKGRPRKEIKPE